MLPTSKTLWYKNCWANNRLITFLSHFISRLPFLEAKKNYLYTTPVWKSKSNINIVYQSVPISVESNWPVRLNTSKYLYLNNNFKKIKQIGKHNKHHIHTYRSFVIWHALREATYVTLLRSENNIGQTMWPLGARIVIVYDFSFFVVDFFALFVAHKKDDAAEEEYSCSPTDTVGPAEFPYRSITWNRKRIKIKKGWKNQIFLNIQSKRNA